MFISLKRQFKPVTDKDHISLILPTRARPEMLAQVFDSIEQTAAQKSKVAVWLYIDHDDQVTLDAIHSGRFNQYTFGINWVLGEKTASLGELQNISCEHCNSGSGIFMLHADDTTFVTPGWDDIIRRSYDAFPDRIMVAHPHDPELHEPTFQMILSAEWIAATGRFSTAYFPYWFDDIWLDQIGQMLGRRRQLPIKLGLVGGKGKTNRMRNVAFWTAFYNHTLDERIETAGRLREIIFPKPSPEKEQNEAAALGVIQQFRSEQTNFSDLYALFREERHSGLPPEQRNRFDENYFVLEARAVARLLSKVRTQVAAKNYQEGLLLLNAALYAELRSPHVNKLKVECLRELGKVHEAEKLEAENAHMWPDNPLLRRIFSFIAYVFVEAKRMIFSKW